MIRAIKIVVSGKVQGVYFRASTLRVAKELSLKGWVENQTDGTVIIHAEGMENQLQLLIDWCSKGPSAARVDDCSHSPCEIENYDDFNIMQ